MDDCKEFINGDILQGNIDNLNALLRNKKYSCISILQAKNTNSRKDIVPV